MFTFVYSDITRPKFKLQSNFLVFALCLKSLDNNKHSKSYTMALNY
jgi:hypothetical protein